MTAAAHLLQYDARILSLSFSDAQAICKVYSSLLLHSQLLARHSKSNYNRSEVVSADKLGEQQGVIRANLLADCGEGERC